MEDSVDIAIRHIQDWAKVIVYIIIGLVAIWVKAGKKRKQQQEGLFDSPEPETAPQQPQPVPARPAKKRPAPKPAERRYFTYENESDYKSMAEQKKQTATQPVSKEEEGSAADFDLRAAVIASEILKPKFEE